MIVKFEDPNKNPIEKNRKLNQQTDFESTYKRTAQLKGLNSNLTLKLGDKNAMNESSPQATFLSLIQSNTSDQPVNQMIQSGTVPRATTLKYCEQKESTSSDFEVDFGDLGKTKINVTQTSEGCILTLNLVDKSKIPVNPLLFKNLVEKQLFNQFGVHFKLRIG